MEFSPASDAAVGRNMLCSKASCETRHKLGQGWRNDFRGRGTRPFLGPRWPPPKTGPAKPSATV